MFERAKKTFCDYVGKLNSSVSRRPPPQAVFKLSKRVNSEPHIEEFSKTSPKNVNDSPVRIATSPQLDDSVVTDLIQDRQRADSDEEEEDIYGYISRKNEEQGSKCVRKNVARLMMTDYNLQALDDFGDYLPVLKDESKGLFLYHCRRKDMFKLELFMDSEARTVAKHLCEIQHYKLWNGATNESLEKLWISSDNTCIQYLKQKAVSEWFRERDFLFLRHLARSGDRFYIFDRSIDSTEFIPFQSIHRGTVSHAITRVSPTHNPNSQPTRLVMQAHLEYGGLLSLQQKQEMALAYFSEFAHLDQFIGRFSGNFKNKFDLEWEVPGL